VALEKLKISDDLFHESVKQKKYNKTSVSPEQAKTTLTKADAVMNEKGVYLEPTLTLGDLAELTGVSTNHLSQVLNEVAGKNFYDYVNSFRLQHFLNVYQSKEYKNFTILALAYECGFKSKSTFNTFFRKNMDMSPSEYVKNIK
jgi:AraC-like DNA-binding protein